MLPRHVQGLKIVALHLTGDKKKALKA